MDEKRLIGFEMLCRGCRDYELASNNLEYQAWCCHNQEWVKKDDCPIWNSMEVPKGEGEIFGDIWGEKEPQCSK